MHGAPDDEVPDEGVAGEGVAGGGAGRSTEGVVGVLGAGISGGGVVHDVSNTSSAAKMMRGTSR